jgi:hypothetical protein
VSAQQLGLALPVAPFERVITEEDVPHPQRAGYSYWQLYHPMKSTVWTSASFFDGIDISIYQFRDKRYQLDAHASRPDWSRKQINRRDPFDTYEAAKAEALRWYEQEAMPFCARLFTEANCTEPHVPGAKAWARDNHCRECGWAELTEAERRAL